MSLPVPPPTFNAFAAAAAAAGLALAVQGHLVAQDDAAPTPETPAAVDPADGAPHPDGDSPQQPRPGPEPAPANEPEPEADPDQEPDPNPSNPAPASAEAREPASEDDAYAQIEILTRAIEVIRQNYVEGEKTSYEELVASALEGMFANLDPHCQYMHPRLFEEMKRDHTDTYDGVGITISPKGGSLRIVSVREDGPAATAGVLPGDVILQIGDVLTDDVGLVEAVRLLQGKPGEPLKMTVRRPATNEVLELEMVRQVIQKETVRDAMVLDPSMTGDDMKIGYVRLLQFNAPSAGELAEALDGLEDEGIEALVLDLRNNPGGLLNSAIEILGEFLPPDTLVLTTEGRVASQNPPPYRTPERKRRPRDYPIAVLVNHGSASASEVVSGALQDLKRAVIVGETTFGKGSVQSVIPMENGAAMRLTTAKYYTPSHRTIHENGVVPNIVATLTPEEESALMAWYRDNSLNDIKAKELAKVGDRQLGRAVDVLKGLAAYRGR